MFLKEENFMNRLAGLFSILFFTFMALSYGPAAGAAELVENGDFRTGDFRGWTTDNQTQCEGNRLIYSGNATPSTGIEILPPPSGEFAAVTDEFLDQSCSLLLYQDITVPKGPGTCSAPPSFTYGIL